MNAPNRSTGSGVDVRAVLTKFEGERCKHQNFEEAFKQAMALTVGGRASRVVIVTGPTGVGKSTLGGSLCKKALQNASDACKEDPSLVPAVLVTATPPHGRSFNWKDFYIRTLEQLNEPLIERKVFPGQLTMFETIPGMKSLGESLSTDPLRRQVEHSFQRRKTKLWIIDEAHHILMCHDNRQLEFQFETLKSLADMCNATLVLLGTYKLLEIRDHSAQLNRRSQIVHFPSYRLERAKDKVAFKSTLEFLAKKLPVPLDPTVQQQANYFFNKTAGCVGILRDLLRDALESALFDGAQMINESHIDRAAQSNKAILRILEESALGCVALEDVDVSAVQELVQRPPNEVLAKLRAMRAEPLLPDVPGPAPRPTSSRRGLPVGQRQPVRDKVGGAGRVNVT